ncbi:CAHS3 [Ramazzottius varieornatus]|uniref:Cytosolic-abundant heat soluble protein 3 n=1 Tax=Ramazzottius varieornatus TaxID=947166 RepID=CAHS3_RAMVA|nr:RecName: Full=Cytosolic-abundant heat soluble protein 3; Short=CAHS3; AltName: Full=Tardigrade-specific intrinsically disordered protein CAHS3; Short=TDP CAHS3 [Ramazzottius varieornatus]BAM37960.1 cytosolic abundant heat soluble protein 3 [Ramazzottius varieornatus]GAV06214.1 CAHS3 [Ramazzottius varieornatus]
MSSRQNQQSSSQHSSSSQQGGQGGQGVQGSSSYSRTEVHTSSGGPTIGGAQRTVPVPPGSHSEVHEEREVIKHGTKTESETHVVTVPVTTFGSTNMESVRTGFTVTQDKNLTVAAPNIAAPIHSNLDLNLGGGARAEITAGTTVDLSKIQRKDLGPEEYARYKAKVEQLARQDEQDAGMRAAQYREEVERDAELIRQILERQHIRDLEFRKEMVENQVNRQEREIQLEAEYAMRALELERNAAKEALESAKAQTNVNVKVESAIGTTVSKGAIQTSADKSSTTKTGPTTVTQIKHTEQHTERR